jgi:hypothetical protein
MSDYRGGWIVKVTLSIVLVTGTVGTSEDSQIRENAEMLQHKNTGSAEQGDRHAYASTIWVEKFEGSNFRESKNFLSFNFHGY